MGEMVAMLTEKSKGPEEGTGAGAGAAPLQVEAGAAAGAELTKQSKETRIRSNQGAEAGAEVSVGEETTWEIRREICPALDMPTSSLPSKSLKPSQCQSKAQSERRKTKIHQKRPTSYHPAQKLQFTLHGGMELI